MPLRRLVHDGTELTAGAQTLLTFGTNLTQGGAIVASITIANRSSARVLVTIHFVPAGASPAESNCIFEEYVPPSRTVTPPGLPIWGDSSYYVSAISNVANSDVGVRVSAFEDYIANAG